MAWYLEQRRKALAEADRSWPWHAEMLQHHLDGAAAALRFEFISRHAISKAQREAWAKLMPDISDEDRIAFAGLVADELMQNGIMPRVDPFWLPELYERVMEWALQKHNQH